MPGPPRRGPPPAFPRLPPCPSPPAGQRPPRARNPPACPHSRYPPRSRRSPPCLSSPRCPPSRHLHPGPRSPHSPAPPVPDRSHFPLAGIRRRRRQFSGCAAPQLIDALERRHHLRTPRHLLEAQPRLPPPVRPLVRPGAGHVLRLGLLPQILEVHQQDAG